MYFQIGMVQRNLQIMVPMNLLALAFFVVEVMCLGIGDLALVISLTNTQLVSLVW